MHYITDTNSERVFIYCEIKFDTNVLYQLAASGGWLEFTSIYVAKNTKYAAVLRL